MTFLLIAIFVVTYLGGPIPAFGGAVMLCAFVIYEAIKLKRRPRWFAKDWIWLVYAIVASIPTVRYFNAYDATFYLRVVILPWMISVAFQNVEWTPRRVQTVFGGFALAAFVAAGLMIFQVAPGVYNVSIARLLSVDRNYYFYGIGGEVTGPNAVAYMCAAGIAIILAELKFFRWSVPFALPLLGGLFLFLIVSGGRNAWVSVAGLLLLFTVAGRGIKVTFKGLLSGGVLIGILAGIGFFYVHDSSNALGAEIRARLLGLINPANDQNVKVRLALWAIAIQMIIARPSGWGFNAFGEQYGRSPHNELLGQAIGGGVLGAFMFVVTIAAVGIRTLRRFLSPVGEDWCQAPHYAAFSLLLITGLAMVTEHIARSGMATFYPIVWGVVGMSYGVEHIGRPAANG